MIKQKTGSVDNVIIIKNGIHAGYDWQQSINERTAFCDNISRGRFIRNRKLSFCAMLVELTIIFLSIRNTSAFVSDELDHRQISRDTRNDLNLVWDEGEEEGNDTFLSQSWGRNVHQGSHTANTGRDLLGEAYIQQQNATNITGELLPTVRIDLSSKPPSETNVTSNPLSKLPVDGPTKLVDYADSIKKGNPLIQSTLPINFRVELVVKDAITNELLKGLETTLENYVQTEYQMLVDRGSIGNKKLLKLGLVDLTLSLVESKWLEDRRWRRLSYDPNISVRGSSLSSWQRKMQESGQDSNSKILTISVNGSVNYSMEVDGSAPTPDDIEKQWRETYADITSQDQLQRAIEDANIQGVVRLEGVTQEEKNAAGGSTNNANEGGSANAGDLASLYENEAPENFNESSGNDKETSDGTETTSKKSSQLERPSTLSIIFGFILTGIAVAGLFVYAYLFYRKRKKLLKKKKKMKETITFSSAGPALAPAARPPPNRNQNSLYYSKSQLQSAPPIQHSSQAYLNSMVLTQTESEETTYRGLESSVGSEDTSDPFAKELKLAASLDEEAWNESQRIKETIEKRQVVPPVVNNSTVSQNRSPNIHATVPSLLSDGPISLEEEDDVDGSGFGENAEWVESYPYGDEAQRGRGDYVNKPDVQSSSAEWEPYNSALPPLVEEKKDETNPSEFFAQKLKNIENDLSASREKPIEKPRIEPSISDDVSDILSEVSEISKYVRRYERRKDRKIKREEQLNERLAVRETPPSSSAKKSLSVERDGRFQREPSNSYESPSPSQPKRLEPYPLSSYAGSFRDAKTQDAIQESLSVVSDDAVDAEDISMRSQRLGISPYSRSKDEVLYEDGNLRKNDKSSSNRTRTTSTRSRSTRTEDDYRYTVGYTRDPNKSPSRLADLRANDAIIDNSNSEVNVNYGISQIPNVVPKFTNQNLSSASNKASDKKDPAPIAKPQPRNKPRPAATNKRFDKLRGMFEQKTNAQPAPIYPPGANWQNGGSLGK